MARATDLLVRIEEGALDPSRPLADTLRVCVALGGRAGTADLRDWARRELDGYGGDDDLPDYRVVTVPILIDGSTFHAIITGGGGCRDAAKTRRSKIRLKNTESVEIRSASRGLVAAADRFTHRQLVELVRPRLRELEATRN